MVALGLVVSQFDKTGEIIPRMEAAAREAAEGADAELAAIHSVPGSYDTPLAADRLARREDIDAVAVIGAVITGETDHDQVIVRSIADSLTQVSLDRDTPVTMGVIGPGMTEAQARERIEYAASAVESAVTMVEELEH